MEAQLNEAGISTSKSAEALQSAQRQISQLDSENILLRQLRVDYEATSRECTQQRRQVATLEAEVISLKAANVQLRHSSSSSSGGGGETHSMPSSFSHRLSPTSAQPQQARGGRDRDFNSRSEFESFPPPPAFSRDPAAVNQQYPPAVYLKKVPQSPQSLLAYASSSSFRASAESGLHVITDYNSNTYSNGDNDTQRSSDSQRNWEHEYKRDRTSSPVSTGSNVRSLADVVARRSTVGYAETSSRGNDDSRRSRTDFSSSNSIESNKRDGRDWSDRNRIGRDGRDAREGNATSSVPVNITVPTAASNPSDRRHSSDSRSNRGNSSGGGMSSFYDDSTEPTARAPFGTEQSAAHNLVSFEDTDRRLTALMTEKSVLYEESARLQQRGGKVLKDRARLQHVDARLEELGREIAVERKKLSAKPG